MVLVMLVSGIFLSVNCSGGIVPRPDFASWSLFLFS